VAARRGARRAFQDHFVVGEQDVAVDDARRLDRVDQLKDRR
jgi:hypothetical protein